MWRSGPISARVFEHIHERYPDVLLVPEHENIRYYAVSAPYNELDPPAVFTSTPEGVRSVYPQAFGVINVADGDLDGHRAELVAAVQRGDILMFRGWFDDPENAKVTSIYAEAARLGASQ